MPKGKKGPKSAGTSDAHIVQAALTSPLPRLIPCAEGKFVYYFDPVSLKCHHLRVSSPEFHETLRSACDLGLGPRIRKEVEEFNSVRPNDGWDSVLEDLVEAELV